MYFPHEQSYYRSYHNDKSVIVILYVERTFNAYVPSPWGKDRYMWGKYCHIWGHIWVYIPKTQSYLEQIMVIFWAKTDICWAKKVVFGGKYGCNCGKNNLIWNIFIWRQVLYGTNSNFLGVIIFIFGAVTFVWTLEISPKNGFRLQDTAAYMCLA